MVDGGDSGLTGRKVVLISGGMGRHTEGARFQGKDPTSRPFCHLSTRYVAKHCCSRSCVRAEFVAYAIGVAHPFPYLLIHSTGKLSDEKSKLFPKCLI